MTNEGLGYTLKFCQDPELSDGYFTLVYDEALDKSYVYKTA
jgi:hypothetical protein